MASYRVDGDVRAGALDGRAAALDSEHLQDATAPGTAVLVPVRSGSTISFSFTLADAFNQTPSFWKDAVLDIACTTIASGNGSSTVPGCPSGTLLGSVHTSYFFSSASLALLAFRFRLPLLDSEQRVEVAKRVLRHR